MYHQEDALAELIDAFARLPGIGRKSAERLAFYILEQPEGVALSFAKALQKARKEVHPCKRCYNLAGEEYCTICQDRSREKSVICVVEDTRDVKAIERTGAYHGLYHVLGGVLSPMDNIGPDDLHIAALLKRLSQEPIEEVILATNPSVEGEATNLYLQKLIEPAGVQVSRLAQGLPMGGDLKYADQLTLTRAFHARQPLAGE